MGTIMRAPDENDREVLDWLADAGIEATAMYVSPIPQDGLPTGITGLQIDAPDHDAATLEAAMVGFVPTRQIGEYYEPRIPLAVRTHLQHVRDYLAKPSAEITQAETVHVVKDLIRAVFYMDRRFETEG